MTILYLTADAVGTPTGGGKVTAMEAATLRILAEKRGESFDRLSREELAGGGDPWGWDDKASYARDYFVRRYKLCHAYSGSFPKTVAALKQNGCKVAYTVAAHDKVISEREHKRIGLPFPYDHLTRSDLWQRYISCYLASDVVVCPSTHSAEVVRKYPYQGRIEIIPHGVDLPEGTVPPPSRFVCGYMGAISPDKGTVYLLQAWKKLNYQDAVLLLAGRDSTSPLAYEMLARYGGGSVCLLGWIGEVIDFYNRISLLVQPSATEGFGLEVLEAMAHARAVIVSKNAGAADVIPTEEMKFDACNIDALAEKIDQAKKHWDLQQVGEDCREIAKNYEWTKIQTRYTTLWEELLK